MCQGSIELAVNLKRLSAECMFPRIELCTYTKRFVGLPQERGYLQICYQPRTHCRCILTISHVLEQSLLIVDQLSEIINTWQVRCNCGDHLLNSSFEISRSPWEPSCPLIYTVE